MSEVPNTLETWDDWMKNDNATVIGPSGHPEIRIGRSGIRGTALTGSVESGAAAIEAVPGAHSPDSSPVDTTGGPTDEV